MTMLAAEMMKKAQQTQSRETEYHGITANMKAAELPDEQISEFSNAPTEFEATASLLWDDTQIVYTNACIANRYSENYLLFCEQLEKNIKQLGSFCLTKAVLEQNGMSFPNLDKMSIREMAGMIGYHLRKAHAALQGIYQDNQILGMTYLNWEFRWAGLDNRLRSTEVKIQMIKEGKINTEKMLKHAETFKGEKNTNEKAPSDNAQSLPAQGKSFPVKGSMARVMLGWEREDEKKAEAIRKEKERLIKEAERYERKLSSRIPGGFDPPKPFGPTKEDWDFINRNNAEYLRKQAALLDQPEPEPEPEQKPELIPECQAEPEQKSEPEPEQEILPPGALTEAEARRVLMEDAMKRKDQEAILAIPREDTIALHERWLKYTARVEREAIRSRGGPSPAVRKARREKRKKRK